MNDRLRFHLIIEIMEYMILSLSGVGVAEDFLFINSHGDYNFYPFISIN